MISPIAADVHIHYPHGPPWVIVERMKYQLAEFKTVLSLPPTSAGKNVRVWTIRQDEILRINLVEMSGELNLHMHPDADHSLVVLEGEVRVQIADEFRVIGKGDFISIPLGVPHKYWSLTKTSMLMSMDAPYYDPAKTVVLE